MLFDTPSIHPRLSFWLDVSDKVIKLLAVAVAAVWTYYRTGIFRQKLETNVAGEFVTKDGNQYAVIVCTVKNVGESSLTIKQEGTILEAQVLRLGGRESIPGSSIFQTEKTIEPGERIEDTVVLKTPGLAEFVALRISVRLVSHRRYLKNREWNPSCILKEKTALSNPVVRNGAENENHSE